MTQQISWISSHCGSNIWIALCIEVSKRFLTMSPMFQVGLTKELKIYGIGVFGFDSFNIFCRDYGGEMSPADKNLQSYCRWRKQQPHRKPGNRAPQTKKSTKKKDNVQPKKEIKSETISETVIKSEV